MQPAEKASAHAIADSAARRSYGKLVAFLAAQNRDVASAEDALAEAFAAALAQWPSGGVPDNPEAWLLTAARRKQIDAIRQRKRGEAAGGHLQLIGEEMSEPSVVDRPVADRRLALMFACAHPAIEPSIRTPLILQTLLGFDAAAIASAFLVSPGAMSQRLVRAKNKIREAGIPFRVPEADELAGRLDSVLEAVYAAYGQGWALADDPVSARQGLAGEALFLGRLLTELLPSEPEVLGLKALMLFAEARRPARRDADGAYVPLSKQNPSLWDRAMSAEADDTLREASEHGRIGRFQLEAAIQSVHAARIWSGRTDWDAIVSLYDGLSDLSSSPVVAINRAVAVAELSGPRAGLAALAAADGHPGIEQYQPYWAARADFLARAGETIAARSAFDQAIGLAIDPAIREFLDKRKRLLDN